jgi:hypothetical protein
MAVTAQAGLKLVVMTEGMPYAEYADSKLTISPSDFIDVAVVDIGGPAGAGIFAVGISSMDDGLGSLDASDLISYQDVQVSLEDDPMVAASLGILGPFAKLDTGPYNANMLLIRSYIFHCEGQGDVTLVLVDYETGEVVDTQVIHQIPEPMTLALLGLGALVMARSRKH